MINMVRNRHRYRSIFFDIKVKYKVALKAKRKKILVYFPDDININDEIKRKEVIVLIEKIYFLIDRGHKKICLDFSKTISISASAMIYVYAEVKNILNTRNDINFKCTKVKNNKVSQVLKQIGFYSMCLQNCTVERKSADVIKWRVCSGVRVIEQEFDTVVDNENEFKQLPPECDLFGACVEATMNVHRHAYIKNLRKKNTIAKNKEAWWCFSQVNDNALTVVVCDLGVSIPYTIPLLQKKFFAFLKTIGKTTDAHIIRGAALKPTSRSGLSYQGNGLPKIAEIARSHSGKLAIHSRKGCVFFDADKNPKIRNYKTSLKGTIIAWTIPMEKEYENNISCK